MKPTIIDLLHGNGNLIEAAHRAGRSLDAAERRRIARVRYEALGVMQQWSVNYYELEGERGVRGSMAMPIEARFRGNQSVGLWGLSTRLYNIEGDHLLNNSTVGVVTLVHNRIMPSDLSLHEVVCEYAKESFLLFCFYFLNFF